ncbi:tyrosine-type recombinase/integrase [Rhodococcus sp. 114MFTsu3.1]|uniref:tyrosine-type recombinase/integrase n=1 Tax=Rhodococcus sp. 114MFTsu3.1 TaxID=1172184 RepID=UPI001E56F4F6|nr:site-specific integrase [Rhodococcus sp. 114MFTsu3.1]
MPVQKLTKGHLDTLVNDLLDGTSVKPDGQPRRPSKATSINPMLNLVSAVLTGLMKQGRLVRDVAALVDRAPRVPVEMQTLTEDEVQRILTNSASDRNGHAWLLALSGLRRGELSGLRWQDIDLEAGYLRILNTRVSVNGRVVEGPPKTERSKRKLPLTPALRSALATALQLQRQDRADRRIYIGPGTYVVSDVTGRPLHPDTVSDYWRKLCVSAEVSDIRLHDARHTCGTLLHLQGVPIAVISAWLGHADNAFTMRTYVHSQNDALNAAAEMLQTIVWRDDSKRTINE